jgi:hypothetical protein
MKSAIAILSALVLSASASVPVITQCNGTYAFILNPAESYTVPSSLQKGDSVTAFAEGIMSANVVLS